MSKDFIHNNILQGVADAIRYCDDTTAGIAPVDYADRIRAIDKLIPQPDALNFYMPNGGTISLNKTGSPTVVELEYWLDENKQWVIWQEDADGNRSITLNVGQRMYVRNTSTISTTFSTELDSYYTFTATADTYAAGAVESLLCKNYNYATVTDFCFRKLFNNFYNLLTAPMITSTSVSNRCYIGMFNGSGIHIAPELPATTLATNCYRQMFVDCAALQEIRTRMTDISATNCLYRWVANLPAQGDFYCPAELTIPTGASGIPSGWTRHDI